jgi:hypothetical protein
MKGFASWHVGLADLLELQQGLDQIWLTADNLAQPDRPCWHAAGGYDPLLADVSASL